MEEEVKDTRQKHIDSLDCAKKAWENFEQTPITEDDITEAKKYILGKHENTTELVGKFVEKDLLCHIPFAIQALIDAFKEHPPQDDLDEDAKDAHRLEVAKETYAQYSSFLDKPHDLAVGYMLSERVLDNCSVKHFYNTKLSSTPEKLVDIFEAYSNHLRYSECEDQSAMDNLKNIEETDLSMMSHDEAVSAIGEVMDAESAAHTELKFLAKYTY